MINHNTLPSCSSEIQTLEILWRNTGKCKSSIDLETKSRILAGIAQNDAAGGTKRLYLVQSSFYEPNTNALPLSLRSHCNWPEAIPFDFCASDFDWREGDMANNLTIVFCHQGNCQSSSVPLIHRYVALRRTRR